MSSTAESPSPLVASMVLDALDGVAYVVDRDQRIVAVGESNWNAFAVANDGDHVLATSIVGKSLFDFISGDHIKDAYRKLLVAVLEGDRKITQFRFRCDAPSVRREMRMSISPVWQGDTVIAALFQSQTIAIEDRPPINLFGLFNTPRRHSIRRAIVTVCSFCHAVSGDDAAKGLDREWVSAEHYYRKGGSSDVEVSHGICTDCFKRIEDELK
ncbi:MAG: PAS domain-containing protein [Rhodospirillaceae bacterium]|nr:PAS domain-containing protein [Rhodospirillaceae bacterium]